MDGKQPCVYDEWLGAIGSQGYGSVVARRIVLNGYLAVFVIVASGQMPVAVPVRPGMSAASSPATNANGGVVVAVCAGENLLSYCGSLVDSRRG